MYFNLSCLLKKLKSILKTPKTCIQSGKKRKEKKDDVFNFELCLHSKFNSHF